MTKTFFSNSFTETQKIGEKIAHTLKGGDVITLEGNLGSGKTTFVQGLARGLGIKQHMISPTFIIVRKYNLPTITNALRTKHFYHIDLYRIESEKDIQGLGLEEIIKDPESIIAIEWPEKIDKILPKHKIDIHFEYLEDDKRKIELS